MNIRDYFINNDYKLVSEYYSEEHFGNRGYTFKKDGVLFIYTCEMGIPYLEFNKNNSNNDLIIGIAPLLGIKEKLSDDRIIELLSKNYEIILKKIKNMSNSELMNIKKQFAMKQYGVHLK